ncbi:hypothetical protein [Aliidongia dinghuensis]|uniref:hypothetical protein n=1 Tax=Aliidongia dinghuensis TaxID=1867774 RepID=UPI00166CC1F6|nr:hypothetical protein [Aliidongia dinghuensis]
MNRTLVAGLAALLFSSSVHAEERIGASYFAATIPANSTATVFAASANVSGASVRTASIATSGSNSYLQADFPDGTHRVIYAVEAVAGQASFGMMAYPILLPPNVGLSISNVGAASQGFVTYDLH